MANATTTTLGDIQLAGDLAGNNNALAPELTATGVTAGSYTVPNVTVDAKGRITSISNGSSSDVVALIPDATTSSKGRVQIGTGLTVNSGVVSVSIPDATTSVKGILQITSGNGLTINDGVLSLVPVDASTVDKGFVRVGTGLTATSGVLSISTATNSVLGGVKVGTTLQINSGVLDVGANIVQRSVANTFTKAQTTSLSTLTDAATINVDLSLSNVFLVTLAGNRTVGTPTNPVIGGQYTIVLKQDATGSRIITWPASFKFRTGQPTTLSTAANKYDVLSLTYVAASVYLCDLVRGF